MKDTKMEDDQYFFPPKEANSCIDPLTRLVRLIYTKKRVTVEDFNRLHREYYMQVKGAGEKTEEISRRGNDKRTITNPVKISWNKFLLATIGILGLKIVEVKITFVDPRKKESFTISTKDIVDDDNEYKSCSDGS